jgi:hypothetical protein
VNVLQLVERQVVDVVDEWAGIGGKGRALSLIPVGLWYNAELWYVDESGLVGVILL